MRKSRTHTHIAWYISSCLLLLCFVPSFFFPLLILNEDSPIHCCEYQLYFPCHLSLIRNGFSFCYRENSVVLPMSISACRIWNKASNLFLYLFSHTYKNIRKAKAVLFSILWQIIIILIIIINNIRAILIIIIVVIIILMISKPKICHKICVHEIKERAQNVTTTTEKKTDFNPAINFYAR